MLTGRDAARVAALLVRALPIATAALATQAILVP